MNPKISVIVPVYNAEKTLHKCIDSILGQSYKDWELLLIDDGSTDASAAICDEYAQLDNRIRAFHKQNGGVSSARNIGLDNAEGEWITFVDSDDFLADNALEIVDWNVVNEDFLLFPFYYRYIDGGSKVYSLGTIGEIDYLDSFLKEELGEMIFRTPWSKLFKRDIIDSLRFNENIKCGEDTLFVLSYLYRINRCRIYDTPFYVFNQDLKELCIKYKQTVSKAVYALSAIYSAYEKLNIRCPKFELGIFFDFKSCCQYEINKNSLLWFRNSEVKRIHSKLKCYMGFEQRLRYKLLSYSIISKMNVLLRR